MLTDALDTPAADRISIRVYAAYVRGVNALIDTYNILGRPDFLFQAHPLTDAPKNAQQRRECAVAVLVAKWRWQEDRNGIRADLKDMRTMGRTDRWQRAISYMQEMLRSTDGEHDDYVNAEYALMQGSVYLNHAA